MSLFRRGLLLTSLSSTALLLAGCPFLEDFPRVGRDDDDTGGGDDDDDDDDASGDEAPVVEITGISPLANPLTGTVAVEYSVTDPDSAGYTLYMTFGDEGGPYDQVPVLLNASGAANEFSETVGGAPPLSAQGRLEWDTLLSFPTTAEGIVVEVCVWDSEDNQGNCDTYPDEGSLDFQNTLESGLGAFCQPGHLEEMNWLGGRAIVPLSDGECLNYQRTQPPLETDFAAQFLLVLVNPGTSGAGFTITATDQPSILGPPPQRQERPRIREATERREQRSYTSEVLTFGDAALMAAGGPSELRLDTIDRDRIRRDGLDMPFTPVEQSACTPDLTQDDVHNDARTFFFRGTIEEGATRETRGANLRALGDHIAVYVDDETPIDFDPDCSDPNNPVQPGDLPAFGFTNCDLEDVVAAFDTNIYPTVTSLWGEPSDVDSDCRVTVFLSHRLNRLTLTNSDPIDDAFVVRSFTEPDVDLWQSNLTANPNSNEQEVIFMYAPDPVGFWSDETVQLEDYLTYEVGGQLASSLQQLISYGKHRNVGKTLLDKTLPDDLARPPAEEDWLDDALGLLAADLTGFGAIAFQDAWIYMDAPHVLPLQTENTLESFQDRGGQYLFARYLHDRYGDSMISEIVDAEETTGEASVAAVVGAGILEEGGGDDDDSAGGAEGDPTEIFNEFVSQWAVAMAVSGQTNEAGNPLVPDATNFNFKTSSQVSVPNPEVPVVGQLYGANGFQQGFNVRGINRTFKGGTDPDGASEIVALRVKTENLDPLVFHPQADFFGYVEGDYGVVTVLVSGLEQPENYLLIETATGEPLIGKVIRINDDDPHNPSLTLEDVDGAKITTVRNMGLLPVDGTERRMIGRIDPAENMSLSVTPDAPGDDDDSAFGARADDDDSAPAPEDTLIYDTDRYRFQLNSTQLVGVWVDRRYAEIDGVVELDDPFVAIVPVTDVPNAFDYTMWNWGPNTGPCADPQLFTYPVIMPLWLAAQANLLPSPEVEPNPEFEALTSLPGVLACTYDHDQDGIPDAEEPEPSNLAEQILLRQAENLAIDPAFYDGGFDLVNPDPAATGSEFDARLPLDVSQPFFSDAFIDIDSNESPDNDFPTNVQRHNIGGRMFDQGEEAVWFGTLPAGQYIAIVGGAEGAVGAYDLSMRVLVPSPSLP